MMNSGILNMHLALELRISGTLNPPRRNMLKQTARGLSHTGQRRCLCSTAAGTSTFSQTQNQDSVSHSPPQNETVARRLSNTAYVQVCNVAELPTQHSLTAAVSTLQEALQELLVQYTHCPSGFIRLEVPIPRTFSALWWLRGQAEAHQLQSQLLQPKVFFSPRRSSAPETDGSTAARAAGAGAASVSGAGAAWMWKGSPQQPLDSNGMASMQRFLGAENDRVRIFGGTRFDPGSVPAPEWEEFGSYYFVLPRVEYSELSGCALLSCTVAWDALHTPTDDIHGSTSSGFATLGAAVTDAAETLSALQPPLPPSAGAFRLAPNGSSSSRHLPDEEEWGRRLDAIHQGLHPVILDSDDPLLNEECHDAVSNAPPGHTTSGSTLGGGPLKVDPHAALDEYMRNGQQGLDDLLAALDSEFSAVMVSSSSSESEDAGGLDTPSDQTRDRHGRVLTKVVLARRTDVTIEGALDPIALLEALQDRDPRAYQVLLQLPSGATFLSSTPECLYCRTGSAIASEAVAGTRARGAGGDVERDFWLAFDLLQSHKDDVEFGVVRDWVRRTLTALCDDVRLEVTKSVLKQGSVQHLYAKLAGTLRPGASDAALLAALHPTPAVCGQPRGEALHSLTQVEPFDRGFYAGPFGWISQDAAEFVVAIRSALVRPTAVAPSRRTPAEALVSLFAGVGIVSGSDTASEWAELNLKINQFQRLLTPAATLAEAPNVHALWARLMVEELCRLGCNTFCVAPGSRSSPLTTAIAQHPRARIIPCIDERSLGFWALGFGRGSGRPAVVVTSSGTAVANLLPSVIEASQSGVPLVVLTADRPAELRDTGANQTIDQVKIFGSYVRWQCDLAAPSDTVPARVALTTIDTGVRHACPGTSHNALSDAGPVHINCQFREPLTPEPAQWDRDCLAGLEQWETNGGKPFSVSLSLSIGALGAPRVKMQPSLPPRSPPPATTPLLDDGALSSVLYTIMNAQRGLLVVGEQICPEDSAAALQLAQLLGWPVVADVLSGLRIGASHAPQGALSQIALISHFDHLLLAKEHWADFQPDVVLQLGGHLTSKRVAQFLEWSAVGDEFDRTQWIFVNRTPRRHDQGHVVSHCVQSTVPDLLCALRSMLQTASPGLLPDALSSRNSRGSSTRSNSLIAAGAAPSGAYRALLVKLDASAHAAVDSALESFAELTEPQVARLLSQELPPGEGLFIGNSMPIRDFDMYALPTAVAGSGGGGGDHDSIDYGLQRIRKGMGVVSSGIGAPVAANRGASGIDGVLSTAAGFADGLHRGCTLMVGDISFLHDINGLNLLRSGEIRPPLTVVLINNGGGSIFSFLPIADHLPEEVFTPLWTTPQNVDLAGMCRAHSIPHIKVATAQELRTALHSAWGLNRHSVVEVVTDRSINVDRHKEIQVAVQRAVITSLRGLGPTRTPPTPPSSEKALPTATVTGATWEQFALPLSRSLTSAPSEHGSSACAEESGMHRRGVIVRLELLVDLDGRGGGGGCTAWGVGEAAPLLGLHQESLQEAASQIAALCVLLRGKGSVPLHTMVGDGSNPVRIKHWLQHSVGIDTESLFPSVRFALEGAILSGIANALGKRMASIIAPEEGSRLSGPTAASVTVNALLDPGKYSSLEEVAAAAAHLVHIRGFRCIKVKVGRGKFPYCGPLEDAATLVAIREAVGPSVGLRADANRAWSLQDALSFGRAVAQARLEYVEEPLRDALSTDVEIFHQQTGIPIAFDESIEDLYQDFSEAKVDPAPISQRSSFPKGVAAVILKPSLLGGFERCMKLAHHARAIGAVPVISSSFESPLGLMQLAHLAAAVDAISSAPATVTQHGLATDEWFDESVPKLMAAGEGSGAIVLGEGDWDGDAARMISPFCLPSLSASVIAVVPGQTTVQTADTQVTWKFLEVNTPPLVDMGPLSRPPPPPPVMFLHGMFGSAEDWLPHLHSIGAQQRHGIALELPGHGKTVVVDSRSATNSSSISGSKAPHPLSLEAGADALAALIEAKGVQGLTLVGYSLGARMALLMASRRPDLVAQVVCIGGTPGIEDARAREERVAQDTALADALRYDGVVNFLKDRWYTAPMWSTLRALPTFPEIVKRRIAGLGGDNSESDLADVLAQASPGRAPSSWASLDAKEEEEEEAVVVVATDAKEITHRGQEKSKLPKLTLIVGDKDSKFMGIAQEVVARARGGHRVVEVVAVPGAGHAAHLELPLYVLNVLLRCMDHH